MLNENDKDLLLELAEESIRHGLIHGEPPDMNPGDYSPALQAERATFVTLQAHGELRGCIGTLEAHQPLVEDVAHNAYHSAFEDPRFDPMTEKEMAHLDIHISILSPPEEMTVSSEEDLLNQLRPNVDGLIIKDGPMRATFLPSVWDSLPEAKDFLMHLKLKAGMPTGHWSDTFSAFRYTAESVP